MLGNRLIVYGGINEKNDYLCDVWEFNFRTHQWYQLEIILDDDIPDNFGIAFHTVCAVYNKMKLLNRHSSNQDEYIHPDFVKQKNL